MVRPGLHPDAHPHEKRRGVLSTTGTGDRHGLLGHGGAPDQAWNGGAASGIAAEDDS